MNSPETAMNDPLELTVAEYAKLTGESENTLRTKISRKKLKTKRGMRDNRECILILVDPSVDHSIHGAEQSRTAQIGPMDYSNQPVDHSIHGAEQSIIDAEFSTTKPNHTNELFGFMRETMGMVQAQTAEMMGLVRENERFKLLTDQSNASKSQLENEIAQLKDEIFKKDARIAELEQKNPDHELLARITQLELQLAEQSKNNSLNSSEAEPELPKGLDAERKKGLLARIGAGLSTMVNG